MSHIRYTGTQPHTLRSGRPVEFGDLLSVGDSADVTGDEAEHLASAGVAVTPAVTADPEVSADVTAAEAEPPKRRTTRQKGTA